MKAAIFIFFALAALPAFAADGPIALAINEQTFQQTLADLNIKLAPAVKRAFGQNKVFLATGDWKKEFAPTSPGGSFYHPDIPGVEYQNRWGVHITGWLARWPGFDTDMIGFVLCHELGHHVFGGENEVEADHFAPTCLRWLWSADDNHEWLQRKQTSLSATATTACAQATAPGEQEFCLRTMSSYLATEAFRSALWKKLKIIKDSEIPETNACRRQAVLRGIQKLAPPECNK